MKKKFGGGPRKFKKNSTKAAKKVLKLLRSTDNLIEKFGEKVGKMIAKEWSPCCGVCRVEGCITLNGVPVECITEPILLGQHMSEALGPDYIVYIQPPNTFVIIGTEKAREEGRCTAEYLASASQDEENPIDGFKLGGSPNPPGGFEFELSEFTVPDGFVCEGCPDEQMYAPTLYNPTILYPRGPKFWYLRFSFLDEPEDGVDTKYWESWGTNELFSGGNLSDAEQLWRQNRDSNLKYQSEVNRARNYFIDNDCESSYPVPAPTVVPSAFYDVAGSVGSGYLNQMEFGENAYMRTLDYFPVGCCCRKQYVLEGNFNDGDSNFMDNAALSWFDCVSNVSELPEEGDFCFLNWIYVSDVSIEEGSCYFIPADLEPFLIGNVNLLKATTDPVGGWYEAGFVINTDGLFVDPEDCQTTHRVYRDRVIRFMNEVSLFTGPLTSFNYHLPKWHYERFTKNNTYSQ